MAPRVEGGGIQQQAQEGGEARTAPRSPAAPARSVAYTRERRRPPAVVTPFGLRIAPAAVRARITGRVAFPIAHTSATDKGTLAIKGGAPSANVTTATPTL